MIGLYAEFFHIATRTELRELGHQVHRDEVQAEQLRRRRAHLRRQKSAPLSV